MGFAIFHSHNTRDETARYLTQKKAYLQSSNLWHSLRFSRTDLHIDIALLDKKVLEYYYEENNSWLGRY